MLSNIRETDIFDVLNETYEYELENNGLKYFFGFFLPPCTTANTNTNVSDRHVGFRLSAVKGQKIYRKPVTFFFPLEVVEMDAKAVSDIS